MSAAGRHGDKARKGRPVLEISAEEFAQRRRDVALAMQTALLDALVVFDPKRIVYLSGFHHVATERPIVLILRADAEMTLVVPALEQEHAQSLSQLDRCVVYPEYPGLRHPMEYLVEALHKRGNAEKIGADHDGVIPVSGYRGPSLSAALGHSVIDAELLVERRRWVKSPAELACIRSSCEWAIRGHRALQDSIQIGRTPLECSLPVGREITLTMAREMPGWRPRSYGGWGPVVLSAARATALPHGFALAAGIASGDVLIGGATGDIDGYRSELERTMFCGEPDAAAQKAFTDMLTLQDVACATMRAGVPASVIEREVRRCAREIGREEHLRHHVGHSIGLDGHEAPFLDEGENTILQEGMVFSVEPGIYVQNLGGFRHSDTVVVTPDGVETLTSYPRGIDALIVGQASTGKGSGTSLTSD